MTISEQRSTTTYLRWPVGSSDGRYTPVGRHIRIFEESQPYRAP